MCRVGPDSQAEGSVEIERPLTYLARHIAEPLHVLLLARVGRDDGELELGVLQHVLQRCADLRLLYIRVSCWSINRAARQDLSESTNRRALAWLSLRVVMRKLVQPRS